MENNIVLAKYLSVAVSADESFAGAGFGQALISNKKN